MCGRYSLTDPAEAMERLFGLEADPAMVPRFNIAPGQSAPVLRILDGEREISTPKWGLVPHWVKSASTRLINARAETVATKFKSAFSSRRCLVPADGFFEWRKEGAGKQPYRIGFKGGPPFAMAGIWERGRRGDTFAIVTTAANVRIAPIHHRAPAIVAETSHDLWLRGDNSAAQSLLRPCAPDAMAFYRVSSRVNDVRNDDEDCIAWLGA